MQTVEKPPISPLLFSFPVHFFFNMQVKVAIVTQRRNTLPVFFPVVNCGLFWFFFFLPLQFRVLFRLTDFTLYSLLHVAYYKMHSALSGCLMSETHFQNCVSNVDVLRFQFDKLIFQDLTKSRGRNKVRVCFMTKLQSSSN